MGRPWNKVFSEICAGIDGRNTVQQHIRQHIEDFIATTVEMRDGELVDLHDRWGFNLRSGGLRQELYVDPRSGLIRINKHYGVWRHERIEKAKRARAEIEARRRTIDEDTQLHRLDGIWFQVTVGVLPVGRAREMAINDPLERSAIRDKRYDAILRREVARNDEHSTERQRIYGARNRYGISKRQLSKRELDGHGLRGPAALTGCGGHYF